MKRREFITLLGGAAVWPLAARAQQPDRVRRIGVFAFGAESDPAAQAYVRALRQGLEQLGWIEGRNIRVDYRWASGDRLKAEVAAMVELAPDVILCGATQLTGEFQQKTRTIPIVFVHVADPVAGGLVESLARPGGNITGFTAYESSSIVSSRAPSPRTCRSSNRRSSSWPSISKPPRPSVSTCRRRCSPAPTR
jgi:ABC-type uncharacterized transport system substrate-binding protein